jgi:hypothetical protein
VVQGRPKFFCPVKIAHRIQMDFSQTRQDTRTSILETLIHHEKHLATQMYAFADEMVSQGVVTEKKIIDRWEKYKRTIKNYQIAPL